jgi:two-component system, cell cycle sensor histidine kinase and response regulator CckA
LLLTDVVMPEMNGVDVATQIVMEHDETCVLFMSGYPNQHVLRLRTKARVGFVEKPFTPEGLLNRVRALLSPDTEIAREHDSDAYAYTLPN